MSYKIVKLTIENFKRIKYAEIVPTSNIVVIGGKNGMGKQQPVSEPILTPKGWKIIGDLKVGDQVIGSSGKPTVVIGVYPQKDRKVFIVKMADGASTRCGKDHLWTVASWRSISGNLIKHTETIPTSRLLSIGLRKGTARRWEIPLVAPIEFIDSGQELPIDPYTLGVILGDGHISSTGYVTIDTDSEILDILNVGGYRTHRTLGTGEWSRPLKHLGLAGKLSYDKFIPEIYQYASIENRRLLFLGLMDTDGTSESSWASFCSTSERLIDGFIHLSSSLGYLCKKRTGYKKKYRYKGELKEGRIAWNVGVKTNNIPFRLKRKSEKWSSSVLLPKPNRFIDVIEQVEDEDSICIKVAADDGLYVTKDFILTHNTSALDSFLYTLCGVDTESLPMPIREGSDYAKNTVDIGDYIITRSWTSSNNTYLQIKTKEGKKVDSPQQFLNKRIGKLSFDPFEFCNYEPKKQVEVLLDLVGLKEPLQKIDEEKKKIYDERTEINRDINRLEVQIKILPIPEGELSDTKIDIQDLNFELNRANIIIRDNQNARNELMNIEAVIDNAETEILRLKKRIVDLEIQLEINQNKRDVLRNKITEDPDVNGITNKIAQCNEVNNKIDKIEEYKNKKSEYDSKLTASEYCTERLKELENEKITLLTNAKFPIGGLGFTEEGLLFNNIPFIQCSLSEKLKVSTPIAMALNPELRVIRIMYGNLLDRDSKQYIKKIIEERDFQVWVEEVCNEKGTVEFYIEDGELK